MILAIVLALSQPIQVAWTCADVRAFVDQHGTVERAVEAARKLGIPEYKIRLAKRCLK